MQQRVLMSTVIRGRRAQCTSPAKALSVARAAISPWAAKPDAAAAQPEPTAGLGTAAAAAKVSSPV